MSSCTFCIKKVSERTHTQISCLSANQSAVLRPFLVSTAQPASADLVLQKYSSQNEHLHLSPETSVLDAIITRKRALEYPPSGKRSGYHSFWIVLFLEPRGCHSYLKVAFLNLVVIWSPGSSVLELRGYHSFQEIMFKKVSGCHRYQGGSVVEYSAYHKCWGLANVTIVTE